MIIKKINWDAIGTLSVGTQIFSKPGNGKENDPHQYIFYCQTLSSLQYHPSHLLAESQPSLILSNLSRDTDLLEHTRHALQSLSCSCGKKWKGGHWHLHLQATKNTGCHTSSFGRGRLWCIWRCNLEHLIRWITSVFQRQENGFAGRCRRGPRQRLGAKSPTGGKGEGEGELHHRFMSPAQNDFQTGQKTLDKNRTINLCFFESRFTKTTWESDLTVIRWRQNKVYFCFYKVEHTLV